MFPFGPKETGECRLVSIPMGWERHPRSFPALMTTKAQAALNGGFLLPLSQQTCTGDLAWMNSAGDANGRYTGNWCLIEGQGRDLSPDKTGKGKLQLRKFADPTENARQFVIPS